MGGPEDQVSRERGKEKGRGPDRAEREHREEGGKTRSGWGDGRVQERRIGRWKKGDG